MAGCVSDSKRSAEGNSIGHCLHSREVLAEWRSSEQLENGTPSTSPPYWDIDNDDDLGPKPAQLYGKYTWKIEKYSQTYRKRELRSNAFEIGGYKWYILIYPQGCDVPNHLSLFLCVSNHDKLLPGWSHFAQFTIAVVNKDPKKSKYSDTLHRFRKKEHDWGWKKFMELPKVLDGFVDADTLIIRAQVQVIREKVDRPFRCLDCQYRRELMRVYLSNVEQICMSFMEERRSKLMKLIEDKAKWASFCTFWLGVNQKTRQAMSKEKVGLILKVVVKHFFIEKEVTSTLLMDSLYSGLMALLSQTKCKKENRRVPDSEEMAAPIVVMENDMFVLLGDVLQLLERAASEPLPPKDEKGPQNRMKDVGSGEYLNMDSSERDEKRLTELGRRTVEIFVLDHIFSNKIKVAYQEVNALRMQEELIREEETAWKDGSEHKAKHCASEKEKKSKKIQAKQKRNNRKGKNKKKNEMAIVAVQQKKNYQEAFDEPYASEDDEYEVQYVGEEPYVLDVYDVTAAIDCVSIIQNDSAHIDSDSLEVQYPAEVINNGINGLSSAQSGISEVKIPSDDSSSTCSTDSFPSVVINGPYKRKSFPQYGGQDSLSSEKNQHNELCEGNNRGSETDIQPSEPTTDASHLNDDSGSCKASECESEAVVNSLQDWIKLPEENENVVKKKKEVVSLQSKLNVEGQDDNRLFKEKTATPVSLSLWPPSKNISSRVPSNSLSKNNSPSQDLVPVRKSSSNIPPETDNKAAHIVSLFPNIVLAKPDNNHNPTTSKPTEKFVPQRLLSVPRPSSAPIIPSPIPSAPVVSTVQTPSTTYETFSREYINAVKGNTVNTGFSFGDLPDPHWADHYPPQRERSGVHENSRNYMYNESRTEEYLSVGIETFTYKKQPDSVLLDDYPHYDIINDLLEDDSETCMLNQNPRHLPDDFDFPHHAYSDSHYAPSRDMFSQGNNHHHMPYENSRQIPGSGFPQMSMPNTDRHDYDFPHHCYSDNHYDPSRDMFSQGNNHHHMPYGNSRQIPRSGLPRMSMPNSDGHDYLYRIPPYSNLSSGVNGYDTIFRP